MGPANGTAPITAMVRGFTLVTRNVKDIEPTGVAYINPWDSR